jgi:hypothetical protein
MSPPQEAVLIHPEPLGGPIISLHSTPYVLPTFCNNILILCPFSWSGPESLLCLLSGRQDLGHNRRPTNADQMKNEK